MAHTIASIGNQLDESSNQDRIITLDASEFEDGALDYLKSLADDSAENGNTLELWGDNEGSDWRIHVRLDK